MFCAFSRPGQATLSFTGKARDDIFAGHFANIGRLADEGKLAIAGPFEKNDRSYRGLYIFNVPTIAEAEKLVVLDPAVKAGVFVPELTLWYGVGRADGDRLTYTNEFKSRNQKQINALR